MKKLNLRESVYQLTEEYLELISILKELGFNAITNPIMRKTLGRRVTIVEGCKRQGKNLDGVIKLLKK